ncbi:MAG: enoyl-ACP reductase FabI [Candidatus Oxydemutatoraceae bacterium WSBS_2016_MAG_OTU14]
MSGLLNKKNILITGVASNRSIAAAIAKAVHREGAKICLTYQNDKLKKRVEALASECECDLIFPCDVSDDDSIKTLFENIAQSWQRLDGLVHSIAFAPREELNGNFAKITSRLGFNTAHEISSYSLTALSAAAQPLMQESGGSIMTLSYLGAERTVPNYNVMGLAKASLEANVRYLAEALGSDNIRVNAISSGPIRTLAASGIAGFRQMLDFVAGSAPLRRNVTADEVGNVAAFLASDLSSGITGEIMHVDAGFNTIGLPSTDPHSDKSKQ